MESNNQHAYLDQAREEEEELSEERKEKKDLELMGASFEVALALISFDEFEGTAGQIIIQANESGKPITLGTIYRILKAWQDRGIVESRWEDREALKGKRGRPPARIYKLTDYGIGEIGSQLNDRKFETKKQLDLLESLQKKLDPGRNMTGG